MTQPRSSFRDSLSFLFVRRLAHILVHIFYRLHVINREAIPRTGGALIVANHLSLLDILFLAVAVRRRVRFVTGRQVYEIRWLKPICKAAGAFPISPKDPPKVIARTLAEISGFIRQGGLVCMFPEGGPSRTGNTLRFGRGMEKIMAGLGEPIIPVYLDRTWGSIWSFNGQEYVLNRPRQFPQPVTVMFGPQLASSTTAFDVRQKVLELGSQAFRYRLEERKTLPEIFFDLARKHPFDPCIADTTGRRLRRFETFAAAWALSRKLRPLAGRDEFVGIFLPTSVGGSVANLASGILGKTVVNFNYTASREALNSAVSQCGIRFCLTSRVFLEKLQSEPPCPPVFLEDLAGSIRPFDKIMAIAIFFFLPSIIARRVVFGSWRPRNNDNLITVVFTSGSTGRPKGVMLSHANIMSNLEGLYQAFDIRRSDILMGVLPFFHSFGYTANLWLPLISRSSAVYHPNPLDAKVVGETVRKHGATLMMATPTFLNAYTKRCEADDFKTVRFTVIGAEKLKPAIAEAFEAKFGFAPLEGYGCTELSPIVSLNFPDHRSPAGVQKAQKPGTIGNPLPGVAVRVVDPETYELCPPHVEGLLLVKGQNVMKGYWKDPELTRQAFHEGWYKTGDIAFLDDDGFVTITDRISRFSKIAGEMVPHIRVEEGIHKVLGTVEQVCIVTSVPDDRKGERLAVLCLQDFDVAVVRSGLKSQGIPNLWVPDADMFFRIESIPVLGSGKTDLASLKRLARDLAGKNNS